MKPDASFGGLLAGYWRDLPAGMAQTALSRILGVLLAAKADAPYSPTTIASAKGTVTFTHRAESDLFDIMPLVRELDRKRYDELLSQYPELRSALDLYPGGGESPRKSITISWTVNARSMCGRPSRWSTKARPLPIIFDEGVVSSVELIEFIRLGLLDGVAMKPARTAGLWDARRQVEILEQTGFMFLGSGLTDPDVSPGASGGAQRPAIPGQWAMDRK